MPQVAMQGVGLNYGWLLKDDAWKPGMDADLVIVNGLLGNRIQAVVNAEPTVAAAPDASNAGKAWIVGTTPSGSWATGKANNIAFRNGETASWIFIAPHRAFMQILNLATGDFMEWSGTAWVTTYTEPGNPIPVTGFFLQELTNTPPTPTSPTDDGKCWGVDSAPTGAWAGQAGKMAMWYVPPGGSTGQWRFIQPYKGWRALSDAVPFADPLGVYGTTVYRDFYLHDGTAWGSDPLTRTLRGPLNTMDLSAAVVGVPYIRVLTVAEASAGALLVALAAQGTEITLRFPQTAIPVIPAVLSALRIFNDSTAKITVDWGDGTEIAGSTGTTGDPGVGGTSGAGSVNLVESSGDFILMTSPSLGMSSLLAQTLERVSRNSNKKVRTLFFTAGNRDLDIGLPEAAASNILSQGFVGSLLITDEVTPNTITIRNNYTHFNGVGNSDVILFHIAQKGIGDTTIVLDNTVTGTNNPNDVLDAIAPATMAQGESRVLRFVRNGGTGGLGHKWLITQS